MDEQRPDVRASCRNRCPLSLHRVMRGSVLPQSRADRIRTCGLFVPNEARYQTALQLDALNRAAFYSFFRP